MVSRYSTLPDLRGHIMCFSWDPTVSLGSPQPFQVPLGWKRPRWHSPQPTWCYLYVKRTHPHSCWAHQSPKLMERVCCSSCWPTDIFYFRRKSTALLKWGLLHGWEVVEAFTSPPGFSRWCMVCHWGSMNCWRLYGEGQERPKFPPSRSLWNGEGMAINDPIASKVSD